MDYSFLPDPVRARRLDRRMHRELSASLAHVTEALANTAAASDQALPAAIALLERNGRVSPGLFAAYYQLVFAMLQESDGLEALLQQLANEVEAAESQLAGDMICTDLSVDGLGSAERLALYLGGLDTDLHTRFHFLPPSAEQRQATIEQMSAGLALLQASAPELAGEFQALVMQVLLASGPTEPGALRFDGASSYQLWGALALSVDEPKSRLQMAETLAHEAGHSFLFGMTMDEPLVRNGDDDLYRSPLRVDPRPMDGIYHATYVSARMHYAVCRARDSGLLGDDEMDECERCLSASARAFEDGHGVVASSADLTATGAALMSAAHRFMAGQVATGA